jgi:hypothetical protein
MAGQPTERSDGGDTTMRRGVTPTEMPAWECLQLLGDIGIGRVCVNDAGYPLAFPMNYRVTGEYPATQIVLRTSPDTTIGRYRGRASVEIDDIDLGNGRAWSVIVRGDLQPIHGLPPYADVASIDPRPIITTGRSRWMSLTVAAISGRRFTAAGAAGDLAVDWHPEP